MNLIEVAENLFNSNPLLFIQSNNYSPKEKKCKLLQMAKNGSPIPHYRTTLRHALRHYTHKNSEAYDTEFDKQIRELRPDWFIPTNPKLLTDSEKKEIIFDIAIIKTNKKPTYKTNIGLALNSFLWKHNDSYDPNFDKQIREIRPDWFITTSYIKKQEWIAYAKSGGEKPRIKYSSLSNYIYKHSDSYDPEFDKQIRELRPDWFASTTVEKKKELLEIAKSGGNKPHHETTLGHCLTSYINKNNSNECFDLIFNKQIRKLRPDWFNPISIIKKQELIKLAKSGANKPDLQTSPLGRCLTTHTKPYRSTYDHKFTKQIQKLRPDWFVRLFPIAKKRKKEILKIAYCGKPKPNTTSNLYIPMTRYLRPKSTSYDPKFEKLLREVRPEWFEIKKQWHITKPSKIRLKKIEEFFKKNKRLPLCRESIGGFYHTKKYEKDKVWDQIVSLAQKYDIKIKYYKTKNYLTK